MNSLVSIHFIVQWLSPFPSLIDLILFFESAKHYHASMSKSYTESCNQCLCPLSLLFYSPTLYLIGNSLHSFVDILITKKINSYMLAIFYFPSYIRCSVYAVFCFTAYPGNCSLTIYRNVPLLFSTPLCMCAIYTSLLCLDMQMIFQIL